MREIELKFKVDNFDSILKKVSDISDVCRQSDTIYVQNLKDTESKESSIWLRVRKVNDTVEMNLKKQSQKKMESEEIEFEVSNYELANQFLMALGYKKWVQVDKKRQYAKFEDINVCMDEVERLGCFVELEILVKEKNEIDYEKKLMNTAVSLGISPTTRVNSHYDTMIYELDNNDKSK